MSYIINNSRGQLVAVVADGTVNTTATSLALVGRAVTSYGEYENENYLFLLENFANSNPPAVPVLGQLWYNSATDQLSVYDSGNAWAALATEFYVEQQKISPIFTGVPRSPTAPTGTANAMIATTAFVTLSPEFSGVPRAPTAPLGTASTQLATTEFVYSVTGNLDFGTIASQNANAVSITGGSVTGIDPVPIQSGGTAANNATQARINLGIQSVFDSLGSMSRQNSNAVDVTGGSITGVNPIAIESGGTAANNATQARINLGIQSVFDSLGSMSRQNANAVNITGGSVTGISPIAIESGGTAAASAEQARVNLGVVPIFRAISTTGGLTGGGELSNNLSLAIALNSNGYGNRFVSTSPPTGGNDGDIWYQVQS